MTSLVSLLLPALLLAASSLAGSISQRVTYAPSDLKIVPMDGYVVPMLAGCEMSSSRPGTPLLPEAIVRLVLPAGATATGVTVKALDSIELPGEFRVYPVQPPRPVSATAVVPFEPGDSEIYSSDAPFPDVRAVLAGTGEKSGFRIADIIVYPVSYYPASGRLRLFTELSLTVIFQMGTLTTDDGRRTTHDASGVPIPMLTRRQRSKAASELTHLIANHKDLPGFASPIRADDPQDVEYVVITENQLAGPFEPLVAWYRQTGLTAEVLTKEWILANYPGVDAPEQIRNFITDYYAHHGLIYVLLAGDTQVIPCRRGRATASPYTDDLPADLYYSDLQWSWDGDHDGIWGEYGDDTVDFYSDVFVGRVPIDDTAQARAFVNKDLGYQLDPESGYLTKALLPYTALYSFYPGRLAQDSIAAFLPCNWQVATFTGMTTTASIRDSINSGFGLCHVVAHGNDVGFYTMHGQPIYNVTAASGQTNGRRLPILTSIACYSGNFEYNDCLAEVLINNPNGGAVAAIMNSRYGIAQPPGCGPAERLDIRFYDLLLRGTDSFDLGEAHAAAKDYYAAQARSGGIWQWSDYELNLFGDPGMPIWTQEPLPLIADYPRIIVPGTQEFPVRVNLGGFPAAAALVRVSKDSDFETQGVTGPDGSVRLHLDAQTEGPFHLVTLARNGIPYQDSGLVRTSAPYVHPTRYRQEDSAPGGNNDSIINPGETVTLPATFRNLGNQTAHQVKALLRCSQPGITILDSLALLGTLAPGDSAFAPDLSFSVAQNCTNGYLVLLELLNSCTLEPSDSWRTQIPIVIATSRLHYAASHIIDSLPGGNRNLRLDPGETAELVVSLTNLGYGHAYDVHAVLRSEDPALRVTDSLADYGDIRSDSARNNELDRFLLEADTSIPLESSIACTLFVQAAREPVQKLRFTIPVGQIRTCDPVPDTGGTSHRYYAYDDSDTSYSSHPSYTWFEVRGNGVNLNLGDDETRQLPLPFPFRYYGRRYTTLSICSNGWLAPGSTTARNWHNRPLPDGLSPSNMICPNWDDLAPDSTRGVWYYDDTAGLAASSHRLIIEWDSVAYKDTGDAIRPTRPIRPIPSAAFDKFQVIIYDSTRTTPTGDNEFLFQYQTANYYGSSTIGIENETSTIGVNYLFDSAYHRAAARIMPGRAIKFTTIAPNANLQERWSSRTLKLWNLAVEVRPSLGSRFVIHYILPPGSIGKLTIYDLAGQLRSSAFVRGGSSSDVGEVLDLDSSLRGIPAGIYFCCLEAGNISIVRKFILCR